MAGSRTLRVQYQDITVRLVNPRRLKHLDWALLLAVTALACVGWVVLYSASKSSSIEYFQRQVFYFAAGLGLALFLACVDQRFLLSLAPAGYVVLLSLLVAVLLFGSTAKGSERWLSLGFIRIQPSEFAKLGMVYFLAWYLDKLGPRIRKWYWFLITFALVGVPMALILKQPNLGTAACLGPITVAMLFVAGCRIRHLVALGMIGLAGLGFLVWEMADFDPNVEQSPRTFFDLKHYQKKRIYAFLHPEADPRGSGWHTIQSVVTVGSGRLTGKGWTRGTQTRLNYLPEYHTDFIFSLLAEEFGFVGALVTLALYLAFLQLGLRVARDSVDTPGSLLAAGVVAMLAFHVFMNIGITLGLLPVTGLPLPFLSYGGSFYMTTMAGVGILLGVSAWSRLARATMAVALTGIVAKPGGGGP
ncbi:MAG TPA: rod shape-determining protein RodA [Candidatus Hydrogenedentes bacterium]|nr:rod shape-determining protein RodA [Candidatus Hydrogenedentota bacterium]HPO30195.1 rod shape-determining protein RodA [Candidatus Hydrogenedentota bacterium]